MSDITFQSQQFAQSTAQWAEEMASRQSERGIGAIAQIPERVMGLAHGAADLQRKQEEAQVAQYEGELRKQKAQSEIANLNTLMDLDIKAQQVRLQEAQTRAAWMELRKQEEMSQIQQRDYSADTQRGLAMLTIRNKKRYDVSGGRLTEVGSANDDDLKRAESVLRGSRYNSGNSVTSFMAERRRLAESLIEAGDEEGAAALFSTLKGEAGVASAPENASPRNDEVATWIVGRLSEHGLRETPENGVRIGRYLSTQADAIHSLANSEQAKGRNRTVTREEAMDWFLDWVGRDENFRRQLYAKAGIR